VRTSKVIGEPVSNVDHEVVADFGNEWRHFDQRNLDAADHFRYFESYFRIFPWEQLGSGSVGMDIGCGSGRWAKLVAPRVGKLYCVDASAAALEVARGSLAGLHNCVILPGATDALPVPDDSLDFAYSLGVLHHIPDTAQALHDCVRKLRPGAPFLLYLYYALDNRPVWFRSLWRISDFFRSRICRMPFRLKVATTNLIAATVYWPLARLSQLMEMGGISVGSFPLSTYRAASFYTMRTDALDRFGTRLEQRFTRKQIEGMMFSAGLEGVRFSDREPYWVALGVKRQSDAEGGRSV
jgi:ubiquinone/menaquinone biosynthesis C-methylase UbiE